MDRTLISRIRSLCPKERYEIGSAILPEPTVKEGRKFGHALSIIRRLDPAVIHGIHKGPTFEYRKHYATINSELDKAADEISAIATRRGIPSIPVRATVPDSDLDDSYYKTLRLSFSHKMAASLAGLGWIGKTDLLVSCRFGPKIRLATVLSEKPLLPPGTPITDSRCGSCRICVDACPAHAANGENWSAGKDRDDFFNPWKCRKQCRKISMKNLGEEISLCGICFSVCPAGSENKNRNPSSR